MRYAAVPRHRLVASMLAAATLAAAMLAAGQAPDGLRPVMSSGASAEPPLLFVPNAGQTDRTARYTVSGQGHSFYFTPEKAVLDFQRGARGVVLELRFHGANPHPEIAGERRTAARVSYLTGSRHHADLATYAQLRYRNLWPGIDMVLRGRGGMLKYEFLVRPGADPRDISVGWAGADSLRRASNGALAIGTPLGTMRDAAPRSFQAGKAVDSRYVVSGSQYGFALGTYDRSRALVIDPGLVYSTFLGGTLDGARSVALDGQNNAYVTGSAVNADFPTTPGAYDTTPPSASRDAFVTKFAPDGSLVYSTFLGSEYDPDTGSGDDDGLDIAVDGTGAAHVVGTSESQAFPVTPGAYRTTNPGNAYGTWVAKLNSAGTALTYATFVGSVHTFLPNISIEVDAAGNAHVAGDTAAATYPTTPGAFDTTHSTSTYDMYVTKLNDAGSALLYSTFLGPGTERGLALDAGGNAYVAGTPANSAYPTTAGAYDTTLDTTFTDASITKLSPTGASLVYSTFLGGTKDDSARDVAVDADGNAYVTGVTSSSDFPTTPGAFAPTPIGDAFVTKLNVGGSGLVYSTYLGTASYCPFSIRCGNIDVDAAGKAHVAGGTTGQTFTATPIAHDETFNGGRADAYVMELDASGSTLDYATYLGGSGTESATGVATDTLGNAHVVGQTNSTDFPVTPGAVDGTLVSGTSEGFVSKLVTPEATGYPRPMSASPARFSLAIAYRECTDANELHGPPLAYGSCGLPAMTSDYLTVGTFDANGLNPRSSGYVKFGVVSGNPAAPPDEADVTLALSSSDVRTKSLSDYAGELRMSFRARITDRNNTPVGGGPAGPATTVDVPLGATFPCTTTADPNVGSTCSGSTTIEAITPGAVTERMRSVWQLDRVRVFDGGPDGDGDTVGGNTVFATAGLFIP